MINKKLITFISICLVVLLTFSTTIQNINAKSIQNKKNDREFQTTNTYDKKENKPVFKDIQKILSFLQKLKNKLDSKIGITIILSAVIITSVLVSSIFDINFFEILLAEIISFLFGLSTWHIFGPSFIFLSPIIGIGMAVDTGSIINGVFATILSVIFGLTFPVSLTIASSLTLFFMAVDPGAMWMY